jgi:hypothetical protein
VLQRLPFQVEVIQTDNGAEFQTAFHWHVQDQGIRHVRIAPVVEDHELLRRRLEEWALFKAIAGENAWSTSDLTNASNWLQRKVAERAHSSRALATLAEHGRTNRVRATARSWLNQQPD